MALLNPVHGLVVPFLCIFTIPLAIFAGITTTLAFSVLMLRFAVVYFDIALALIPQYITGRSGHHHHHRHHRSIAAASSTPYGYPYPARRDGGVLDAAKSPTSPGSMASGSTTPSPTASYSTFVAYGAASGYRSPRHRVPGVPAPISTTGSQSGLVGRRSRRSSQVSLGSLGTITPIHEAEEVAGAGAGSGLMPSVGLDRDFEGVGGWRLDERDNEWTNLNSRFEVHHHDRVSAGGSSCGSSKTHQVPQSGGPVTPLDGGYLMMKPSRRRTSSVDDREPERGLRNGSIKAASSSISPNSSRVRLNQNTAAPAPLTVAENGGGKDSYFPAMSPTATATRKTVA